MLCESYQFLLCLPNLLASFRIRTAEQQELLCPLPQKICGILHKFPHILNHFFSNILFIYLFGVLRRFQHCTGHITTGSWKGRGNQYIQFVRVLYCKLPTNGKQLPAFPLETVRGSNPGLRGGRQGCYHSATVAPSNILIRFNLNPLRHAQLIIR